MTSKVTSTKKTFKIYDLRRGWTIERIIEDEDVGYGLVAYNIIAPGDDAVDTRFTLADARDAAEKYITKAEAGHEK